MVAGRAIIAGLDSNSAKLVKRTSGVELAGEINFRGRRVPKIVKNVSAEPGRALSFFRFFSIRKLFCFFFTGLRFPN